LTLVSSDEATPAPAVARASLADEWNAAVELLPGDWSDLLCELELTSSDHIERGALLLAPLNPILGGTGRPGFRFRCASSFGYGASPGMVRRCFARLDEVGIPGEARIVRTLSDAHPVGTQGPVWYVGGEAGWDGGARRLDRDREGLARRRCRGRRDRARRRGDGRRERRHLRRDHDLAGHPLEAEVRRLGERRRDPRRRGAPHAHACAGRGAAGLHGAAAPGRDPSRQGEVVAAARVVDDQARSVSTVDAELAFAPALELAELVRRGELSSAELVELYRERIERLDPQLNAFVTLADDARPSGAGPFHGVPIPIK